MSKTVVNGKVEIYTESFGTESHPPVLLIAGAMAPAIFWNDSFCEALSLKGFYVIRFDNRDIGKSTHFPQSVPGSGIKLPYTIEDMKEDAKAVLDAYSNNRAHIIGHSLGGSIAQLFAVSYPEKALSLTAVSSPILATGDLKFIETDPVILKNLWKVLLANPMHQDFKEGAPEFMKIWRYLNGAWEIDEAMALNYTKALYETETIGPAWNHTHVQQGICDIIVDLEKSDIPLLFIHGENDYLPSNPENTKILANRLPNADVFVLAGGGHMFFNKQLWEILLGQITRHISAADIANSAAPKK